MCNGKCLIAPMAVRHSPKNLDAMALRGCNMLQSESASRERGGIKVKTCQWAAAFCRCYLWEHLLKSQESPPFHAHHGTSVGKRCASKQNTCNHEWVGNDKFHWLSCPYTCNPTRVFLFLTWRVQCSVVLHVEVFQGVMEAPSKPEAGLVARVLYLQHLPASFV